MIEKIIHASAGTGKTHTILDNVFHYDKQTKHPTVSYDQAVAEINKSIFLTFSNSAAEEIRTRIYEGLTACKTQSTATLKEILGEDKLKIRVYTIHSFSLEMLRRFRYKLYLPADMDFSQEDDPVWDKCVEAYFKQYWDYETLKEKLELKDKAVMALFEVFFQITDQKSLQEFIQTKGDTVFFLAQLGNQCVYDAGQHSTELAAELKSALNIDVNGDYSKALTDLCQQKILLEEGKEDLKKNLAKKLADKQSDLAKKQKELDELKKKDRLTATQQKKLEKLQADIKKLNGEIERIEKLMSSIKNLFPLLDKCSYFVDKILDQIGQQYYIPRMMANGIFDFDAVTYLFIKELLRENKAEFLETLKQEQNGFEKLYIDEAQDNDIIQNYLILLLGQADCPVKVIVVGDLKQSIYGWRDSHPKEFEQILKEGKAYAGGSKVEVIRRSFRLESAQTRDIINTLCERMKEQFSGWWYEPQEDNLLPKDEQENADCAGKVIKWSVDPQHAGYTLGPTGEQEEELKTFLQDGQTAVLVRSRPVLQRVDGLKDILAALQANDKLADNINSEKEKLPKSQTLKPELDLILLFFMALSTDKVSQVPFAYFWTEAGKLLAKKRDTDHSPNMPQQFKKLFEDLYNDARTQTSANRLETLFRLMDKYQLWKYLQHGHMAHKNLHELRRIFCHILTRAQLAEDRQKKRPENTLDIDNALTILEEGKLPAACYMLKDYKTQEPVPDVITIHTSKGRAYERAVVVADFNKDFFEGSDDFRKCAKEYSSFFCANFGDLITQNPQIKVSYFPYLGLIPAYLLKANNVPEQDPWWVKFKERYDDIKNLIQNEKLNLLYVAMTRVRKDLLLIDVGSPGKKKEGPTCSEQIFAVDGIEHKQIAADSEKATDGEKISYQADENATYKPMKPGSAIATHAVRSEIAYKAHRKYGGKLDSAARLERVKIGSMVHNTLQRFMGHVKSVDELVKQVQTLQGTLTTESLQGKAAQIVLQNSDVLKQHERLLQGNYRLYHEVPVWRFNNEELVKGSIDTLCVGQDEGIILEYKVLFDSGADQGRLADRQMEIYEQILQQLKVHDYPLSCIYIPLRHH